MVVWLMLTVSIVLGLLFYCLVNVVVCGWACYCCFACVYFVGWVLDAVFVALYLGFVYLLL